MPRGSKQLITAFIPKAKEQVCMVAILLVYIPEKCKKKLLFQKISNPHINTEPSIKVISGATRAPFH
jgi:uncharacterized protein with WD repeat